MTDLPRQNGYGLDDDNDTSSPYTQPTPAATPSPYSANVLTIPLGSGSAGGTGVLPTYAPGYGPGYGVGYVSVETSRAPATLLANPLLRLAAYILDSLILAAVGAGLGVALIQAGLLGSITDIIVPLAYSTILVTMWNGQTVGKRAVGIRVQSLSGDGSVGWVSSALRAGFFTLLALVSAAFALLGGGFLAIAFLAIVGVFALLDIVWLLWDAERQCLHDKVAGTIVVTRG